MKFTDEQKEVLALLPTNVKETNELTDAAKLILANLMYLNGTDFAKNEGYLFRTNQALMQDTGIKSEKTIIAAVNKLIELGFIERKAGQRKSASEYRLNTVKIQEYTVKIYCKNENYSNKLQYKEKNTVKNYSNKLQYNNDEISLIINELQNTVKKLQYKITVIEDELLQYKNYSIKNYSENKNYSTDIDIDKEIDTISKDKLIDNDNTEGRNSKEKNNIKEKSTKDNLEILKENSTVEIPNDEDIQSENKILNEIENTSRDNISDNEIPSDLPFLDVDSFVEISNNENISDSDSSKNELELSIFGNDIISEDENFNNDTTVKLIDGKFQVVSETEDEINSSSDVEDKNKINLNLNNMDNSSNTISDNENLNNENNISFEIENTSKVESSKDNFKIWGKLQPVFEKTSNVITGYLFTEYDNLNDCKNVSDGYHQVKQYISIDKDQIKVSVNQTGSFGILSFKDNVYSFIPCNSNIITPNCAAETAETSNNALQASKTSKVDNNTTEGEKIDSTQSQIANKASDDNNDTTANDKEDEKATEMPNADENTDEVDNYTTSTEITAGNSVKMRPEPSDSNTNTTDIPNNALQASKTSEVGSNTTNTEKVAPVQSQTANNESIDMCYTMYGVTADEMNDILSHHGNDKGAWRNMKIKLHNEETTISKALDHFKDKKEDGKEFMECNTFFYYYNPICLEIDRLIKEGKMTEEQKNDCITIFGKLTKGKFAYWHKVFTTRPPRPNFPSEQEMWKLLGCPQVTNKTDNKNINKTEDNNMVYEDNVILPSEKDFKTMNLDEIKNTLLNFVQERPNISDDKKAYINNLCIAYTLEPQYIA